MTIQRARRIFSALFILGSSQAFAMGGKAPLVTTRSQPKWLEFPQNFQWCVATSAHQIEGSSTNNNWYNWEQSGHVFDREISGPAVDHWNRLEEDTALLKNLGVSMYRMSVEWSKIETEEGIFNEEAIAHYRREIELLRAAGINPAITLQHFTIPLWVVKRGGWAWVGLPKAFARFARVVAERIAPDVRDWYTLNEPMVVIGGGYYTGELPPGINQPLGNIRPMIANMLRTHAAGYRALHNTLGPDIQVGVALHLRDIQPANLWSPIDQVAAKTWSNVTNWAPIEAFETGLIKIHVPFQLDMEEEISGLASTQDYIGINYYSGDRITWDFLKNDIAFQPLPDTYKSDIGWEFHPQGLTRILKQVTSQYPGKPIVISENGIADGEDVFRAHYLKEYLQALHSAIQEGVPVQAYCHWSLMDNFEWREGYHAKFGLYEVDFPSQRRTLRASGEYFKDIVHRNGLSYDATRSSTLPNIPPRALLAPNATPWSANARVYSNESGCKLVLQEQVDASGESTTKFYVSNGRFVSNPAEGVLEVRKRDDMVVGGPRRCHNYTPWTRVANDLIKCGGIYDALHVQLKIESRISSGAPLSFRYRETSRANNTKRFFRDVRPEQADVKTLNDFRCDNLKEER